MPVMSNPLMSCLGIMLITLVVSGCGNKGDLFLPTDVQLSQELDIVSDRIGEVPLPTDSVVLERPESHDLNTTDTSSDQPSTDDDVEPEPAKKAPQ